MFTETSTKILTKYKNVLSLLRHQPGVHVHLFSIDEEIGTLSALILTRADNGLRGVISGKVDLMESLRDAALREILEETDLEPEVLIDTDIKLTIPCRKYLFEVTVFAGIVNTNKPVLLNQENRAYRFIPVEYSAEYITIEEQRAHHHICCETVRHHLEEKSVFITDWERNNELARS